MVKDSFRLEYVANVYSLRLISAITLILATNSRQKSRILSIRFSVSKFEPLKYYRDKRNGDIHLEVGLKEFYSLLQCKLGVD